MATLTNSGDSFNLSGWPMTEESTVSSRTSPKCFPPPPEPRRRVAQVSNVAIKTKLCHRFVSGRCINSKCTFAHGEQELRRRPDLRKTKLCDQWLEHGVCQNGADCTFAHGQAELQSTTEFFKTTLCPTWKTTRLCDSGVTCRHAHGQEELRATHDRIPPPPESRFSLRREPSAPPPPSTEHIPSPPTYPPPDSDSCPGNTHPPTLAMDHFVSSASYSENDYLPRPLAYVRAKRGQRFKASSLDRWRNQRRPPPPPPPPVETEALVRKKPHLQACVPPPPLQEQRTEKASCEEDWASRSKFVDKPCRRSSMIELKRRPSQQEQWPRNHSVSGSFPRRNRRQSLLCADQKPAAVDAYPLAAMVSNLLKSRREVDEDEEQVITGVLLSDGRRVCCGVPIVEEYQLTSIDEGSLLSRGFVLLPAAWFASADLRAPAALTAWFLPPGVQYAVAYSKPVKAMTTAARLWPCSEWAESTILSTDIPPSSDTSIYG